MCISLLIVTECRATFEGISLKQLSCSPDAFSGKRMSKVYVLLAWRLNSLSVAFSDERMSQVYILVAQWLINERTSKVFILVAWQLEGSSVAFSDNE